MHALKTYLMQHSNMPFVDYMQMALYAPLTGYYNTNLEKLGSGGDFVTAPELTPLFGKTIAIQFQQILALLKNPVILEFGAGTGQLCVDILTHLEKIHCLPEQYLILEVSAGLKNAQQTLITEKIPHLKPLVRWLDALPETSFQGVLLANEVLDAMPVHRFMQTKDALLESYISLNDEEVLEEHFLPCSNERLKAHVQKLAIETSTPYISEVNLYIDAWIKSAAQLLEKGAFLMLDYGFPRHEYYHKDRYLGTLMCHYQHQAHTNFLAHAGEQDITAHVDFTHVAEAALSADFHVAGFTNQAAFLLANGILELLSENNCPFQTQAVKKLLQPSEMGELFKVMALTKDLDIPLNGFQFIDKRNSL